MVGATDIGKCDLIIGRTFAVDISNINRYLPTLLKIIDLSLRPVNWLFYIRIVFVVLKEGCPLVSVFNIIFFLLYANT